MDIIQPVPGDFCLKCRGCCRFSSRESVWSVHLLEEEKTRLRGMSVEEDPGQGNFVCVFLGRSDNKCGIYPDRPFECRMYPFVFDRKEDKFFLALDLNCAYVKENISQPEFKDRVRAVIKMSGSPESREILKNNPQLFQDYDGVLDLIELKI